MQLDKLGISYDDVLKAKALNASPNSSLELIGLTQDVYDKAILFLKDNPITDTLTPTNAAQVLNFFNWKEMRNFMNDVRGYAAPIGIGGSIYGFGTE